MRYEKLTVAVDFDGTLVKHAYPAIGDPLDGAYWLHRCQEENGARIILWTIRDGDALRAAVEWCEGRGLRLFGVNRNPLQGTWSTSAKVYANVYVDDAALGCPLVHAPGARPYVDWKRVGPALLEMSRVARIDAEKRS